MRPVEPSREVPDLEVRAGCIACGGDLAIRLREGAARSVCRRCGWWSSLRLGRRGEGLTLEDWMIDAA